MQELEQQLHRELSLLNYPPSAWVPLSLHNDTPVEDVVIIGGGMCGLAVAFALLRKGITRIRIFDRSVAGKEGPWDTFARMETLRSPKNLTGPACEIPSLTFRAWFEAQFGERAWESLDKIQRTMWMDYLIWYRKVLQLPVENSVEVKHIQPEGDLLASTCSGAVSGRVFARKAVIATGRSGQGAPFTPPWIANVPHWFWAHSSDDIAFDALRGKRIAVIGAGASAMDNAAVALENGAATVQLFVRRTDIPRINKLMSIGSPGFTAGFPLLSEAWRWKIMHYSNQTQTPPPRASVQRVSRHANAFFHMGQEVGAVSVTEAGEIRMEMTDGSVFLQDFLILGTGFTIDMSQPPGLIDGGDNISLWRDRYTPPQEMQSDSLASSPYLGRDFAFTERVAGATPWLKHIYCFNHAASLSLGKVSGDIPRVSDGAAWLAENIAAQFYEQDIELHWEDLVAYSTPELLGDEWTPTSIKMTPAITLS